MEENKTDRRVVAVAGSVERNSAVRSLIREDDALQAWLGKFAPSAPTDVEKSAFRDGFVAALGSTAAPQQVDAVQAVPEGDINWLLSDMDAMKWANEFCKRNPTIDHGLMLSWFACAIMTGFDEATRRLASPSPAVPPGPGKTKVVPLEPTEAMLRAAISYREVDADDEILDPQLNMLDRQYRAMIAAAPQPTDTTAGE